MWTNKEMADMFIEARDKGFVSDLLNNAKCDSECDDCPANRACTQLTEGSYVYKVFVGNYNVDVLPIIKEEVEL